MAINIKIAPYSSDEYFKCLEIRKKVFTDEQKVDEKIEREFEEESTNFLLTLDEKVAATGRFRKENTFLKFERMAVLKEYRGQNLGSKLLKHMMKIGNDKYPTYLQMMHAQEEALNFYKKMDWEIVGNSFQEANINHYVMINFFKEPKYIKNLKCLEEPSLDINIKNLLNKYI